MLGFASRAVGLDTIRLGGVDEGAIRRDPIAVATEIDPTTRLTFGKTLGPNVDVTFSQSLRESEAQTWIVDYRAARAVELRLLSGDDDLRAYSLRHDLAFGGPDRATRPASNSDQDRDARVGTVRFSGEMALPEAQLREVLRLGPGDRFDVADWQADRDRVEQEYHEEGYLTARVTPIRADGPDGVDLEYRAVSGPATEIRVVGIALTSSLRTRLATAWAQSVFDDFLVDEVSEIVRGELAGDRYLDPAVDVRITEEGSIRVLSVDVEPGDRFERTVVRIDGVGESLIDDITRQLAAGGVVESAVLGPAAVEQEVAAYLRAIGYVRAQASAGAPLFEAGTAVVPVIVETGPVFTMARVAFEGAERTTDAALRGTAGLVEGSRYDPAAVDAARDRLAAMYRREGFPSATVSGRAEIGPDGPVEVIFTIVEGGQQVLGEVVVIGNRAIDADVIVEAVGLSIGAPLSVDDLLQARARVFETGLFRHVDVQSEPGTPASHRRRSGARAAEGDRRGVAGSARALRSAGEGGAPGVRDRAPRPGAGPIGRSYEAHALRSSHRRWWSRRMAAPGATRPRVPRYQFALRIAHRFIAGGRAVASGLHGGDAGFGPEQSDVGAAHPGRKSQPLVRVHLRAEPHLRHQARRS